MTVITAHTIVQFHFVFTHLSVRFVLLLAECSCRRLSSLGMDLTDPKSCWMIFNISLLLKLLKWSLYQQVVSHLKDSDLLPDCQLAYTGCGMKK